MFAIVDVRAAQHIQRQLQDDPEKLSRSETDFWQEIAVAQNADLASYLTYLHEASEES